MDLKKELRSLYNASVSPSVVDVPAMNFITVDGVGGPNTSEEYQRAVESLFALSYTIKFSIKKRKGEDYGVLPLEGLWWVDDLSKLDFDDRSSWRWTAMMAWWTRGPLRM